MQSASNLASVLSLLLSICAIVMAVGAKEAVKIVLKKKELGDDTLQFRSLLTKLNEAKAASDRRHSGASTRSSKGKNIADDIDLAYYGEDALKMELPSSLDGNTIQHARAAAEEIRKNLVEIKSGNISEDYWANIRLELQQIIPRIKKEERKHNLNTLRL